MLVPIIGGMPAAQQIPTAGSKGCRNENDQGNYCRSS